MKIIERTVQQIMMIFFRISVTSEIGESFLSILNRRYKRKIRKTLMTVMKPTNWPKESVVPSLDVLTGL